MSLFPAWHFREMDRGEINVDPVHDEFFKAQDLADALVREAIQNSLDARRGHSRVRVRFRFAVDDQALAPEVAREVSARAGAASRRRRAALAVRAAGPRRSDAVSADRGLRHARAHRRSGLRSGARRRAMEARNDFYYFWRNVGRTGKGEMDRGRWGLGKAVFSVSSRIRTIFGLTLRADDERRLLLGQSVLKTHILDGHRRAPYGFLAHVGDDSFPHALADEALLDALRRRLRPAALRARPLDRRAVPSRRRSSLRAGRGLGGPAVLLPDHARRSGRRRSKRTASSRRSRPRRSTPSPRATHPAITSRSLCALTRWSMLLGEEEWIADPGAGTPARRSGARMRSRRSSSSCCVRRFDAGDRLAFRIHLPVRRKRSRAASSYFAVLLEKDEQLKRGEHHFIRRGITIPEVRSPRDKPVRAILVADDDALSTFLGDAENPAHSDWSERNDKIRNAYDNGASTLRYVKNAISQLAALVTHAAGRTRTRSARRHLLGRPSLRRRSVRSAAAAAAGFRRGSRSGRGPRTSRSNRRSSGSRSLPVAGGFALRGSGSLGDVGVAFLAEVAYRTRNGNPFRKYSALRFHDRRRTASSLRGEGATVRAADGNRLEFLPTRPDFHLALTGFDARRDLIVRVSRKDDDAAEAELH